MKLTQEQMVEQHLKDYGTITTWEAFQDYGITRLSAKIYNLRKSGLNIKSELMTKRNRYGSSVNFAKYVLESENDK